MVIIIPRAKSLQIYINDLSRSCSSFVISPFRGKIVKIETVIDDSIAGGDAVLTSKINGTNITNGSITIASTGSTVGVVDSTTPTGNNVLAISDCIEN